MRYSSYKRVARITKATRQDRHSHSEAWRATTEHVANCYETANQPRAHRESYPIGDIWFNLRKLRSLGRSLKKFTRSEPQACCSKQCCQQVSRASLMRFAGPEVTQNTSAQMFPLTSFKPCSSLISPGGLQRHQCFLIFVKLHVNHAAPGCFIGLCGGWAGAIF